MTLLADSFASSTGGYLAGLGVPILVVLIGSMWKAWAGRLAMQDKEIAKIQESATEQNKALAVLLSEHTMIVRQVNEATRGLNALDRSLAVLQSQVSEHHRETARRRPDRNQPS